MAELKTKQTESSVANFLDGIADEDRRKDCHVIVKMMKAATKSEPKMWGASIIGFGFRRLKYESGRELDWFVIGFSPRKNDLTLYLMGGLELLSDLLKKLGKHKTGKGCIYIKKLSEVDLSVLKAMVVSSVKLMAKKS